MEKTKLSRDAMAARLAQELQDGWIVNLGVGMPTNCSNYLPAGRTIILHSENGVIGYGEQCEPEESPYVVNAGGQPVKLNPFAAIVHHADSFGIIRTGLLDVGILGAYEVAVNGDFANWNTTGRKQGGIGGAMDIAACAQQIFLLLEHTQRDGTPRLLRRCKLPITAPGNVTKFMTDLGLFETTGEAFRLLEIAPGYTPDEIQELTDAPLLVADDLREVDLGSLPVNTRASA